MACSEYTSFTQASSENSPSQLDTHANAKTSIEKILHKSPLQTTAWYTPMAAGGLFLATAGGFMLHLLPGTALMIISTTGYVVCVLLFAIIPENPNYWAYILPAMIGATVGVDITYSVSNIFITTSMPKSRQGLAGALINCLVFLGISIFLGFADIVAAATTHLGVRESYKVACWFGVGCAAVSLLLLVVFVKIEKAKSDLTVDEKAELEVELMPVALLLDEVENKQREASMMTHVDM